MSQSWRPGSQLASRNGIGRNLLIMSAEVRITPGEDESADDVYEFLRGSFFLDEPMNSALKRMPKKEQFKPLNYLKSGYSLAAYVKNGNNEEKLAGVVLNRVRRRDEAGTEPPAAQIDAIIFNLITELDKKSDVWSKVASDELFYTVILSVGRGFRGLNIGRRLIEESLRKARVAGFKHAIVECSSFYSARIIENLDYEKVGEVRYGDYRDENGELMLKVDDPHEAIIKYLKKL